MIKTWHLVARTNFGLTPLTDRTACVDLWKRLHKNFPHVLACVLMPNHLHFIIEAGDPSKAKQRLAIALRSWSRRFYPKKSVWMKVPDPSPIPNDQQLMRQIRYIHLNPCRKGLTRDPFEWEWSTHLDASGCIKTPWLDKKRLCQTFKTSEKILGTKMHQYISGDPSVSVSGTAFVSDYKADDLVRTDAKSLLWASAVVLRTDINLKRGPVRELAIKTACYLNLKLKHEEWNLSRSALYKAVAKKGDLQETLLVLKILSDPRFKPSKF
jgi:REP element-mobilizing transposase RayT